MLGLKTFRTMKKIVTGLVRRGVRDALHRLWGDRTRLSLFFCSQSRGQRGWMHIYHMNTLPAPPRPGREVEERSISSPSPHVLCRAHNADCHVVRTAFLLLLSSLHCMARHCFFFFSFQNDGCVVSHSLSLSPSSSPPSSSAAAAPASSVGEALHENADRRLWIPTTPRGTPSPPFKSNEDTVVFCRCRRRANKAI